MGLFSRMKDGVKSKANSAIDKMVDPEKEIEMMILELEEQRKKALQELVSYKANAKQMNDDIKRHHEKAATWEKRAMLAINAHDDDAAREALRQKKTALAEADKIQRDCNEVAGHAIALNKSRKEFETKLQILKLKKGTLATQLASARSGGGDAFGHDTSVWDRFQAAEERIDDAVIASEVDAALRGESAADTALNASFAALGAGSAAAVDTDDALTAIKEKVAADREAKQRLLAASQASAEQAIAAKKADDE